MFWLKTHYMLCKLPVLVYKHIYVCVCVCGMYIVWDHTQVYKSMFVMRDHTHHNERMFVSYGQVHMCDFELCGAIRMFSHDVLT